MKSILVFIGAVVIATAIVVCGVLWSSNAGKIGDGVGTAMGTAAGLAAGSLDGFKNGLSEGAQDGREQGLSAEDTTAALGNEIRKIGTLRVLEMDITMTDVFSVGIGQDKPDDATGYMALLVLEGTASYTVDLERCSVSVEGDTVKIFAPYPLLGVDIDPEKTRKRAQNNAPLYGSSYDGYVGYINSLKMTEEKVREGLVGYESMKTSAENAARSAIERLAGMAVLDGRSVVVEFTGADEIELSDREVR